MSRGPGRLERVIGEAFRAEPERKFGIGDLIAIAFPGIEPIEKKHRVSALRAARGACRWTDFVVFARWAGSPETVEFVHRDRAEAEHARRKAVFDANLGRLLGVQDATLYQEASAINDGPEGFLVAAQ